jgi:phosphoribosylformylglycinamidine synthase
MSEIAERTAPEGQIADEPIALEHGMTAEEYAKVCGVLGRQPTVTEIGMYSVMWSEHCSYKSSRVHLKTLPVEGEAVLQGPGENAGAVDLGDGIAGVFKVESHNHPSYIEPYQGAATGVGGILRDIFTMGARPLALLDSLRFGELDSGKNRHLLDGVVGGIAGYGNCMGIPTIGGEVCFDPSYDKNPLVNAMCFGIAPADRIVKAKAEGTDNPVIYVGAKTGRDGIYGVSLLASATFDAEAEEKRPAVQVGDPFTEKVLMEACLEIIEKDLIIGMQDFGGAGLSCATSEMASNSGTGMEIDVALVPRRESGLTPYEVMLSESQERMMLVTTPELLPEVMGIFDKWDLDAVVIGKVTDDGLVRVLDAGVMVAEVPAHSLAEDGPCHNRPYTIAAPHAALRGADLPCDTAPAEVLSTLLRDPNIASKRWVFQQYDQTVRYNTVQRPGGEAAVVWLKEAGSDAAVAISLDGNPWYTGLDARRGTQLAVAEACRNVACTGARPLGITNCLNFGSPEIEARMGQFAAAVKGMGEACVALGVPVTGGNVSFYNETVETPILPTPVIGAVGKLDHYEASVRSGFANAGDRVWLAGAYASADAGLGGSAYVRNFHGRQVGAPPTIDLELEARLQKFLVAAAAQRLLGSAKDCSDGGLAVALAEACFTAADMDRTDAVQSAAPVSPIAGIFGLELTAPSSEDGVHAALFGEAASRVVLSADSANSAALEALAAAHDVPLVAVGTVTTETRLLVEIDGSAVLDADTAKLHATWAGALAEVMERD